MQTSERPEDELIEAFHAKRLSEKKFECPSISVFYENALTYHNVVVDVQATGQAKLNMRQIQSMVKSQILSTEGGNIQFMEIGDIIYIVHPHTVEDQINGMLK